LIKRNLSPGIGIPNQKLCDGMAEIICPSLSDFSRRGILLFGPAPHLPGQKK